MDSSSDRRPKHPRDFTATRAMSYTGLVTHSQSVFRMPTGTVDASEGMGPAGSRRRLSWAVLTAIMALVVLGLGLKKPSHNWDMIGYVAVALSAEGYQGAALNQATYDSIRREVDAATFDQLIQGNYRETVYRDPLSLAQQLPFYRIRVVYIGSIRLAHAMGMDYPRATYAVSALFAALSVVVLALIGYQVDAPVAAVPFVVLICGFIDAAGLSTPDALACFFTLLTIYMLIRRSMLVFVLAVILPLVRTDLLLLSLLVLGHAFLFGQRKYAIASMLGACIVYGSIVKMTAAYGWLTLFNTSLILKTAYPATLVPSHAFGDYFRPYVAFAYDVMTRPDFVIYGFATCFLLMNGIWRRVDRRLLSAVFVIPMAFFVMHAVLFPAITYRFFVAAASLVAIGLISQMRLAR